MAGWATMGYDGHDAAFPTDRVKYEMAICIEEIWGG